MAGIRVKAGLSSDSIRDRQQPAGATEDASPDWRQLTQRIRVGDSDAFGIYYERFFDVMLGEAIRILNGDENQSLDIVQDAMLKAGRCMRIIQSEGQLVAWSRTVVKSVALDWLRKQRWHSKRQVQLPQTEFAAQNQCSVDEEWMARAQWIEEQLAELPSELQAIVHWRYRLGWTLQSIAVRLGRKPGAIDGKLRRLVLKLRTAAGTSPAVSPSQQERNHE